MLHQSPSNNDSSPAEVSPVKYLSAIITSSAAAVFRLETWSDSASEETYIFYSPARDFDGLQILLTRSPSNYQILFSRIYTQDSPVEYLLTSPQPGLCMRSSTTCFSISTIHNNI